MFRSRYLFFVLIAGLTSLPISSQDYQVTVSSVHVWLKVVDKSGQPVTGLTMADFEVYEDNKKVSITCFEEQVIAGSESPAQTSPTVEKVTKKFVLFLDLFNTSSREWSSIRSKLSEFVTSLANGGHEVMLAALMPNGRMGIVSPFTKDMSRIRILIGKAQPGVDREIAVRRNLDELNKVILADDTAIEKASTELVDRVRDAQRLARSYARQDQQISEFTLKAVEKFAEHMSTLSLGEDPVVVYVSGGFSVDPGRQYYDIVFNVASAASSSEELSALSQVQETNVDMRQEIRKTLGKLNKLNVTFYTIDTAGLGSKSEYQDSLVEIANETGGTAFYNSQNFQTGFTQVMTDLNHQYLLCYSPPPHTKSGEYHKIKVVTKRPGVDLRHRRGYSD